MPGPISSPIPIDTDGTFAANSDLKIPSQKAAKTYADTKQVAGSYAASGANGDITSLTGLTSYLTSVTAPIGAPFVVAVTGVDFKTTAVVDLFTVRVGVTGFICTGWSAMTTGTPSATIGPTANLIESGASGAMWFGSMSGTNTATWIGTAGRVWNSPGPIVGTVQATISCLSGNKIQLSITAATATTLTGTARVAGYYY